MRFERNLLRLTAASLALLCGLLRPLPAQEPADQDKTGQGSTEHKQLSPEEQASNAALTKAKTQHEQAAAKKKGRTIPTSTGEGTPEQNTSKKPEKIIYDFELPSADGKGVPLSSYRGKVVLLVNLARNSSYNGQLPALEKLSEQYKDKGLVVLGVPSNDFGAAEPGTDPEIQKIYKTDDKVTFPVMAKSSLAGTSELPLYAYLTKTKGLPAGGAVRWNYTKFLVDRTGKVVARFSPDVAPDSPELTSMLDQVVEGRYKPHKPQEQPASEDDDED